MDESNQQDTTQESAMDVQDAGSEKDDLAQEQEAPEESGEADAQAERSGPHFDGVDIFFYIALAVLGDIGDSVWIFRFFFGPLTILWLYLKGVRNTISKNAIAQGVELIPILGWLPISTAAAVLTILFTNHPELFEKAGTIGKIVQKFSSKK